MSIFTKNKSIAWMMFGIAVVFTMNACAGVRPQENSSRMGAANTLTQAYVWHDGDRAHTVWLNPQMVAEFNPAVAGAKAVTKASSNAKEFILKRPQTGIRMWQLNNTGNVAIRSMASSNPTGKYSPVFHDGPNSGSSMRALPGNIIVYLDPAWDQAAVNAWLRQRNLQVVKKLNVGSNIYVIKTGPGLEALEVANALYQSGEVKAAFPDWWQEVVAK